MSHAHFNFLHARARAGFQNGIEYHECAFSAFERETFFPDEFLAEKRFENFSFHQPLQRLDALFARFGSAAWAIFNAFAHPVTDGGVVDVHELEANRAGIRFLHDAEKIAQFHAFAAAEKGGSRFLFHIRFAESKSFGSEARIGLRSAIERIDVRLRMTEATIIFDDARHFRAEIRFALRGQLLRRGRRSRCARLRALGRLCHTE